MKALVTPYKLKDSLTTRHAGGREFESRPDRLRIKELRSQILNSFFVCTQFTRKKVIIMIEIPCSNLTDSYLIKTPN